MARLDNLTITSGNDALRASGGGIVSSAECSFLMAPDVTAIDVDTTE